jgi:hypothetical protein
MVRFSDASKIFWSARFPTENCSVPKVTAAVALVVPGAVVGTTATLISGVITGTTRSSLTVL